MNGLVDEVDNNGGRGGELLSVYSLTNNIALVKFVSSWDQKACYCTMNYAPSDKDNSVSVG